MNSSTTPKFRDHFRDLPMETQELARKNFKLWLRDPRHPSLRFKKVGKHWSVRIGRDYRALADFIGDSFEWFWIGPHEDYKFILGKR